MSIVEAQGVHKSYGAVEVLKGVSFAIEPGQVVAIIGRSGSGKSTMLRCLNGLETINAGNITVAGHKLDHDRKRLLDLRRDVGMVFQSYNLFPHLTVGENIALAPSIVKKMAASKIDGIVDQVLTQVGLLDKKDCYPEQLSGGQQQRVAIARALITDPALIVADEPTGDLDRTSAAEILAMMQRLNADAGKTIIMVTHDAHAAAAAGSLVHLEKGELIRGEIA